MGSKTQTKENDIRQRILAQRLSKAGADIIIGHGGRNMKGIEQINQTTVLYDIGVSILIVMMIQEKLYNTRIV